MAASADPYIVSVIDRMAEQGHRLEAQGRRIDDTESAHTENRQKIEKHADRIAAVERDLTSIKTTLRIIGGAVVIASPILTAILVKVMG